jgi:hypothetical protein
MISVSKQCTWLIRANLSLGLGITANTPFACLKHDRLLGQGLNNRCCVGSEDRTSPSLLTPLRGLTGPFPLRLFPLLSQGYLPLPLSPSSSTSPTPPTNIPILWLRKHA